MSFTSSVHSLNNDPNRGDLETKIECVDSMVAMLGRYVYIFSAVCLQICQLFVYISSSTNDLDIMSKKFLAMSSSPANCDMMRSNRIVQYLVQILHGQQSQVCKKIQKSGGKSKF